MKRGNLAVNFTIASFLIMLSCSKESTVKNSTAVSDLAVNNAAATNCALFAYADTIFYPGNRNYEIRPINRLRGRFGGFPNGLDIDEETGEIEVTESESGLKYMVWYVARGSTDTCKTFLTISGVNYIDSIYTMDKPALGIPVYNAKPLQPTDCSGDCEFDDGHDDDDGDGFADEPPIGQEVIPQGIAINKLTGVIDFKKSINNGALGANPQNGTVKNFRLNYRIADKSGKALNHVGFRLYYYKTKADIPKDLRRQIEGRKDLILLDEDNDPFAISYDVGTIAVGRHGEGGARCRPPYIIVTTK